MVSRVYNNVDKGRTGVGRCPASQGVLMCFGVEWDGIDPDEVQRSQGCRVRMRVGQEAQGWRVG